MKSRKKPTLDLENITPILFGVWRRLHKLEGPPDRLQTREFRSVVAAVKALQEKSVRGESLIGKNYFEDLNLLGAHLLYDWVVHYQQGLSIFGELSALPSRVLDVCSGAAPFAFAALRYGANEVIATDQSQTALQLAGQICGRYGMPLAVRPWNCLKEKCPVDGKFDFIVLGHCLEELFPSNKKGWEEKQHEFVKNLLSRLAPNGHLAIVDNSFLEANTRVLRLRDCLVSHGVPVQAPCVWRGECPALKTANSPCYAQREFEKTDFIKEIQRAASINLSSLKMTYIIFKSPESKWPYTPANIPLYRVISPPVETFSGKRFYLCGTDGKKQLGSHLQSHPLQSKAFEYLRRGELIAISDVIEKQNAIDIVEKTKISVVAAAGKPLPDFSEGQ